ncbi:Uncharacterised protein [Vibrio cholerae]|nr:Uncharacterised protein [Vibrio cholerae]
MPLSHCYSLLFRVLPPSVLLNWGGLIALRRSMNRSPTRLWLSKSITVTMISYCGAILPQRTILKLSLR